ncbi:hypothetical protein ACSLGG_06695 [Bacillus mycoides]|uniref:hypothetical protein n=1 Tax=Bacillus mycoides TaxID=1405 RepID=UPI003F756FA9
MSIDKADMSRFPLGRNGREVYDVVYLGGAVPNYVKSNIPRLLFDEYVFLFTTMLRQNKDSSWYGHVEIDFMKHELLSCFNQTIRDRGNYHILSDSTLKINDFLEIVQEENDQGKQIIAHLKKQNILKDYEIKYTRDFKIILVKENNHNGFDNLPVLELGPEFQAKLDWDLAEERRDYLYTGSRAISGLSYRNKNDLGNAEVINKVEEILERDIKKAEEERNRAFDNYLSMKHDLLYVHKSISID